MPLIAVVFDILKAWAVWNVGKVVLFNVISEKTSNDWQVSLIIVRLEPLVTYLAQM